MKWIYWIIGCLIITGCSPEPVLRLETEDHEPSEKEIITYHGAEYIISEKEKSSVLISFYRHIDDRIIMDLEATNHGSEITRFDPTAQIDYTSKKEIQVREQSDSLESEWIMVQEHEVIKKGKPLDPEETLLEIDKEVSKAKAQNRTNNIFEGISGSLTAISDLTAINESPEERKARQEQRTHRAIQRMERRENYYRQAASLNEQRRYWETETLRTTDLYPGDSVAGEINIPVTENATHLTIAVTVGNEKHLFRYLQHEFAP